VDSQSNFLSDVEAAAKSLRSQQLTPLLLLPRHKVPEAARAWRYLRQDPAQVQDLPVRRRSPEDEKGITAYFHNVPAYQSPLSGSCFVVAREDFSELGYLTQDNAACVGVSATPKTHDTLVLRFEWSFSNARGR
jgi:hypothetical protein